MDAVVETFQVPLQFGSGRFRQRVDDPILFPFRDDHSFSPQVSEMLGDLDLRLSKDLLKMADAKWRFSQEM